MELELKKTPKLRKFWNLIKKNDEKMDPEAREQYVGQAFFHLRLWVMTLWFIASFYVVLNPNKLPADAFP